MPVLTASTLGTLNPMDISLTWKDCIQLGLGHKVERDGFTLAVKRPLLPTLNVSPDGLTGSVTFKVDETDPLHKA